MIPVASYAPDMADSNPGVSSKAENVIVMRDANGIAHKPQPGLASLITATALPSYPRGGTSAVDSSGNYHAFVAASDKMYKMGAELQLDASVQINSGYTMAGGDNWSFARFGPYMFANNRSDGLQKFDLDSDTSFSAVSPAPKARYIFPAFGKMFALDCDGDNKVVQHSAFGNAEIWDKLGADYIEISDGEELMCGAGLSGDHAIILQRNAIRTLSRAQDATGFRLNDPILGRGVVNPEAFCAADGACWFLDNDGFYEYSIGNGLRNIGADKVNRTFLKSLNTAAMSTVQMVVDKVNNRVLVRYQSFSVSHSNIFEDILVYDYRLQEWSTIKVKSMALFMMASPGYVLDSMDQFGTLDSLTISLDSRFWSGGEPRLAAIDETYKFSFFDGANLKAVSDSASMVSPKSVLVTSITPYTDADNATVTLSVRNALKDDEVWKTPVGIQPSGRCPVRGRGKIIKIRHEVPAGEAWEFFRGIDTLRAGAKLGGVK